MQSKHVWRFFEELSRIPRQSKREEKVCVWLEELAWEYNLESRRDAVGNMVITIPATSGYENAAGIVIQGHTDMVCEKRPDVTHDFSRDPIRLLQSEDGWLTADGTTLGADNGIGVALGLALLEEKDLPHAQIELLFTVDEETGLTGANSLEAGFVSGKRLINLDSSDEGVFTIGCAGGRQTDITVALIWQTPPAGLHFCRLTVGGLTGGHSGVSIHEQRANAISLLAGCLNRIGGKGSLFLTAMEGGNAHNAIARDAWATFGVSSEYQENVPEVVRVCNKALQEIYGLTDPNLAVSVKPVDASRHCLSREDSVRAIDLLYGLPHGVQRMSADYEGVVETSCNLAQVKLQNHAEAMHVTLSQRSFNLHALEWLTGRIEALAKPAGGRAANSNGYPAWQPKRDSALLGECKGLYREMFQRDPVVEVIHAGLECGIIGDKHPGMDMISMGPDIENLHSPDERVNIDSVERTWDFLRKLLPRLK